MREMAAAVGVTAPDQKVNKLKKHARATRAQVKTQVQCGNSDETERSHYFTKNDLQQLRLGQDFFNQPCMSLAKAFLGKVSLLFC